MEERYDDDFYQDIVDQKINLIFVITALVANLIGTIANVFIFGMSITTIICMSFSLILIVALIVARVTKKYRIVLYVVGILLILFEFPALYLSYREAAIPYMILGIFSICFVYRGKAKYTILGIASGIYLFAIASSFAFPEFYRTIFDTAGELRMLISAITATLITGFTVATIGSIITHNYSVKNNEYIELNKRLERMNHYDSLTPCYNRKFLMDYLQMNCNVRTNNGLSIILFDLIDLGYINFKYGYSTGDLILSQFADIIFAALRGRGIVARYDGQKFVAVVYATAPEEIKRIINGILDEFKKYCDKNKGEHFNVAYGITICKSNFSVDDELKIVYARSCDYASKLPKRNYDHIDNGLLGNPLEENIV